LRRIRCARPKSGNARARAAATATSSLGNAEKKQCVNFGNEREKKKMAKHPEVRELEAKLAELREQHEGADVSMKVALFMEINSTEQLLNMAIDRHKEIVTGKIVGPGNANFEAWAAKS
jgi:hypothetical protein